MSLTVRETAAQKGMNAVLTGVFVNILLCIIKAVTGIVGNSYALVADAIESASDVFSSIIVWLGLRTAAKAPDDEYPYGYGKAEPIAAIAVSISLVISALIIVYQSIIQIITPHQAPAPFTAIVLVIVIFFKELLFRFNDKTGAEIESKAVQGDAWHHRSDAISSLTALVGIIIALLGGEGYESADDWAALAGSGLIGLNAWYIFRPALAEIMDEAQPKELIEEIRLIAKTVPRVCDIEKCFIRKTGLEYYVEIHIVVDGKMTVREGHDIAHLVKDKIIEAKPNVYNVHTHVEPTHHPTDCL